jgi:hypothetical protein
MADNTPGLSTDLLSRLKWWEVYTGGDCLVLATRMRGGPCRAGLRLGDVFETLSTRTCPL